MALKEELREQGDYLFKYRSYLPLGLLITAVFVEIYQTNFVSSTSELLVGEIVKSTALFFGLLGLIIRALAVGYAARNTSGRNTRKGQVANKLNTTGLYSITRSPLYLGNYFMWLAICCLTGSIWFVLVFSLVFWIYYERIVYAEEAFLREKFGDEYLEWAAKTPVFLPTHFKIEKPAFSFNWRRVFRQEKNGFFALFFLFWFFEVLENFIKNQTIVVDHGIISIAAIAAAIVYIILKILKKYSSVLSETEPIN